MKHIFFVIIASVSLSAQELKTESLDLMPWPQKVSLNQGSLKITSDFKLNITGNPDDRIFIATTRFLRRLDARTGLFFKQGISTKTNEFPDAVFQINCKTSGKIELNEDESYQLEITPQKIILNATNDLGVLHGLETLLQLLQNDDVSFFFSAIKIEDAPRFTWRGLMIDCSRHFQPIDVIKRNLDAMAAMKMNVFHWHLSDDQGWRIEMKTLPKLTELASDGQFYTQEEIKGIVKYASDRGILVVPEIDVPGHATAILTAIPEIGSKESSAYSLERNSGVFNPTLDPTNPKTYTILGNIFDEVCPLFPGKYFHIGGDENSGEDWDSNLKIQEFKKKNNLKTNHDLQTYFNMKLLPMLKKHNKELMGWDEILTKEMSKEAIIHSWRDGDKKKPETHSLIRAAREGHKTVLSNGFYIDLVLGLENHYLNEPIPKNINLTKEEKERILGGEATMWAELVSPQTIDSRIWPRTAAIAERLWSDASINDMNSVRKRLKTISFRLEELGITHIKNRDVILRNITNNQKTEPLLDFANISEPLKGYTRNKEGVEYKTYSPLTLFADACVPDAPDALDFNKAVNKYLSNKTTENKKEVADYLKKWILTNEQLIELSKNAPLIQPILPLSKDLSSVCELLLKKIDNKNIKTQDLATAIEKCNSKEYADVELAVYENLKKLSL